MHNGRQPILTINNEQHIKDDIIKIRLDGSKVNNQLLKKKL